MAKTEYASKCRWIKSYCTVHESVHNQSLSHNIGVFNGPSFISHMSPSTDPSRNEGNLPNYFRIVVFTATAHYPLGLGGGDQDRGFLVEARAGVGLQDVRVERILKIY